MNSNQQSVPLQATLDHALAALDSAVAGSTMELDLDPITQALRSAQAELARAQVEREELLTLKVEISSRITAMRSAVRAVRPDVLEEAVSLDSVTSDLSAETLVREYHKAASQFRDAFPANYRYLRGARHTTGNSDWSDFKS